MAETASPTPEQVQEKIRVQSALADAIGGAINGHQSADILDVMTAIMASVVLEVSKDREATIRAFAARLRQQVYALDNLHKGLRQAAAEAETATKN